MMTVRQARNRFTIVLAAGLVAFAGIAAATAADARGESEGRHHHGEHRGQMLDRLFERYDADGDGRLSRAEMEAARTARAERLDLDGDGEISRDEFVQVAVERAQRRAERRAERYFDRMADGSDSIATDSLGQGWIDRIFEKTGADPDEGVSREDLRALRPGKRN